MPSCGRRLCWCAPCDASAALCRGEFKRRQTRVLTDVAYGDLIGADAGVRTGLAEVPRLYAGQPALLDVAVRLVCFRRLVAQAGDDGQVAAERLEGFKDRRHGEAGARFFRRPAIHDRAVRKGDEGKALRGLARGRLSPRGCGGTHRVEERQRDGRSDSLQDCTA